MHVEFDKDGNLKSSAYGEEAIAAQAKIVSEHMRSKMIIKLCLYVLAAFFSVSASFLVVFAPSGRETSTWIIAGALVIVAAGSAGFSAFAIRTPKLSASFGQTERGAVVPLKRRSPSGPRAS